MVMGRACMLGTACMHAAHQLRTARCTTAKESVLHHYVELGRLGDADDLHDLDDVLVVQLLQDCHFVLRVVLLKQMLGAEAVAALPGA
jgi:hypothetical protein